MSTVISKENARPAVAARPPHVGVLLVNLGTPDTADAAGVRVYLKEFLSDPRVVENQGLVWKLILNGIILQITGQETLGQAGWVSPSYAKTDQFDVSGTVGFHFRY